MGFLLSIPFSLNVKIAQAKPNQFLILILSLALFVFRIITNNINDTFPTDNFAFNTNFFNTTSNFHPLTPFGFAWGKRFARSGQVLRLRLGQIICL